MIIWPAAGFTLILLPHIYFVAVSKSKWKSSFINSWKLRIFNFSLSCHTIEFPKHILTKNQDYSRVIVLSRAFYWVWFLGLICCTYFIAFNKVWPHYFGVHKSLLKACIVSGHTDSVGLLHDALGLKALLLASDEDLPFLPVVQLHLLIHTFSGC